MLFIFSASLLNALADADAFFGLVAKTPGLSYVLIGNVLAAVFGSRQYSPRGLANDSYGPPPVDPVGESGPTTDVRLGTWRPFRPLVGW